MAQLLTDAIVKRLPVPAKGNKITYDVAVRGFGCRITAAGARAFILNYRVRGTGAEKRYTIGAIEDWTTGAARTESRRLRRLIDEGGDPLGDIEAERAAPTVNDLIDRFLVEHVEPRTRPATASAYRRLLERHARPHFGKHKKVSDVGFEDIDELHRKITKSGTPYVANRVTSVLSKMFGLSVRWKMRTDNPGKGVAHNYEIKRKRYLQGDELPRLIEALAAYPDRQAADVIKLLMLTGARRGEVESMRWADLAEVEERGARGQILRRTIWTKLGSTTKQKADHSVPLGAPAMQLLADIREHQAGKNKPLGTWVFPSSASKTGHIVYLERAWRTILRNAGIDGLRIHDLRHSFASQLVSSGASLPLIGAMLGHSTAATTHRYSHLFTDVQAKAADTVGAVIVAAGRLPPNDEAGDHTETEGNNIRAFSKRGRRGR